MEPIDNPSPDEDNEPRDPEEPPQPPPTNSATSGEFPEGDQGSLQEARNYLRASLGSGAELGDPSSVERQQAALIEWAQQTGRIIPEEMLSALLVVSDSTSEHKVRFRVSDERAVKTTLPGFYGQVPIVRNGRLEREPATPAQYLARMILQEEVFPGSVEKIELAGIYVPSGPSFVIGEPPGQPSFVITQHWYRAIREDPHPSSMRVDEFLKAFGFLPVAGSYFGWVRSEDGVVIVDARTDNFILTAQGVIPIDLQMARFDPEFLQREGVRGSDL